MNHIVAGIFLPFVAAFALYVRRGCRASLRFLVVAPLGMVLGATWSVLPDLPRILGLVLPGNIWDRLDARLESTNPWIDVFCFHYTLNRYEGSPHWFNVMFVCMVGCVFAAAWRELRTLEREH